MIAKKPYAELALKRKSRNKNGVPNTPVDVSSNVEILWSPMPMRLSFLALILSAPLLAAQAPKPTPLKPAAPKAASPEAEAARKAFSEVLDAVDKGWFGQPYQGVTSVQVQGSVGLSLTGAAVNQKVDQLSQGQVKGGSKGTSANLRLNTIYFANGDFKSDVTGDFNQTWTRRGDRGFIYDKGQNAYTTRIDRGPSDAPLTYLAWFRQTLNDIKAVYVDAPTFKANIAGEEKAGGKLLQRIVFNAPTSAWDAKKREQSLAETLGFWKRGKLEVLADKESKLPMRMDFSNEEQGVRARMDFNYANGKLQAISIANSSRGFEGPGYVRIAYNGQGLISTLAGELTSESKRTSFDLSMNWSKDRQVTAINTVPPAGAVKKGREELETGILVAMAGQILELQRNGLNLRSVTLASK
jgi:hypothetical protein